MCLKSKWKWQNDHYLCNHFGTKCGAKQQGQEQVEGEESKGEEYEEDMDEEQEDTEEEDESDEESEDQEQGVVQVQKSGTPVNKNKKRRACDSFKCNCSAHFNAVHCSQKLPSSQCNPRATQSTDAIEIEYWQGHNHFVNNIKTIGNKRISKTMKVSIEKLLQEGYSVNQVWNKLDTDFEDMREQRLQDSLRPLRDHHLSYMDVYNVLFKLYIKKAEKALDAKESAKAWMNELAQDKKFFTYMRENGGDLDCGFASPFQIDQLLNYSSVICFDGTRQIFG